MKAEHGEVAENSAGSRRRYVDIESPYASVSPDISLKFTESIGDDTDCLLAEDRMIIELSAGGTEINVVS